MKVPLWIAAAVPAALAGHTWLYAICACGHDAAVHAWVVPAFRFSLAVLTAICALLLWAAVSGAEWLSVGRTERVVAPLLFRLFLVQTLFYLAAERLEGNAPTLLGILLQLAVAIGAALLVAAFARLLDQAAERVRAFAAYLRRCPQRAAELVLEFHRSFTVAVDEAVGYARFQRPPPIR